MPFVKKNVALDNKISMEDEATFQQKKENIFWQTSANDKRPKLKV